MAAPSEEDRVRRVLHALIELLERAGEPHASYAEGLRRLDSQVEEAHDRDSPELLQYAIRHILSLNGGMGSFRDVVLMNAQGVLPEQDEFYELRGQLFEAARDELR
ncbi:unnamed protein product [[Actinomadura] parvosata subsp. kistnae]|uniref:DUF6966 domain-containing protein n=1 Tax=[Actinomadura] parvosata subsp. kistnae TaxID=1909395 RepID=A0A1V0A0L9_9ACTN|nr:hypothetical protein [Nonomuraea sp. ATCC 55076]AQZ63738.1 hypothetical protein BKM31_21760 [Nonomuraea sp. ATCC 55076]SPL89540.1 unnamed protein product [Actinomadura parvosata subsp. kistnae]